MNVATVRPNVEAVDEIAALLVDEDPAAIFQRLSLVLGHIEGFCYVVDRNLVFRSSLGAGLAGLNLLPNQLVGMPLVELWGTSDPEYEPYRCHADALGGVPGTYQDVCLGRSLEYQLRPLLDASGAIVGVVGFGLDVTEREKAKQKQNNLANQLRHAQKMEDIGRLAGGVAHDFNNHLTCIMGQLELARRQLSSDSAAARHLLECNRAVESAATLTRQLLAFGRKQVISPRALDLSELLVDLSEMLARLIGESVELVPRLQEDLWSVRADPGQIQQVVINLLVNAKDAITEHGRVEIQTRNLPAKEVPVPVEESVGRGDYVLLEVRDSGKGMSEAVQSKLFEPFFTTKEMGEGTGLGLATVYGAVRQNGGMILVESQLNVGSTFRIFLPRFHSEGARGQVLLGNRSVGTKESVRGGDEVLLLVEDEALVLELAQCTLQQLGYQVIACQSPDEALRTLEAHRGHIHLLLTDVVMPRMNGKQLASRVKAFRPGVEVLYSSGYGEKIIAQQGVLDEGVAFIEKPYRPDDLARAVRAVLDAAKSRPLAPDS